MKITNARICGKINLQEIVINNWGIIEDIYPVSQGNYLTKKNILDVAGDWISLGGVDLQINGCLGLAFPDLALTDIGKLEKIGDFLWQTGVDGFLPTIVTTSVEKILGSLAVIAEFMDKQKREETAQILGVHLEGPFLNHKKRGAHPIEHLLPLTIENIKRVLGNYSSIVKIITLAPELDPTGETIKYLHSLGITVSLGHSLATAKEAKKAFNLGANMVTHAFNAMPSLHHRDPGLLGEAITNPSVYCGLIADGEHVCSTMVEILLRSSNYQKGVFLVSDALAPLGLPEGIYPWDKREIEIKNGTAKLLDGTLSGTTLPLFVGVQNLLKWGLCDMEQAIAMATETPRKAISLSCLSKGQTANLVRWRWDKENKKLSWSRYNGRSHSF